MDIGDYAQKAVDDLTDASVKAIRSQVGKKLLFSGACYYCTSPVHSPHIFCDVECRDDYEYEQRLRQREGKPN
jgi:hypothetical protein